MSSTPTTPPRDPGATSLCPPLLRKKRFLPFPEIDIETTPSEMVTSAEPLIHTLSLIPPDSLDLHDLDPRAKASITFNEPRRMKQKMDDGYDIRDEPVAVMQDMMEAGVSLIDPVCSRKLEKLLQRIATQAAYKAYLHFFKKDGSDSPKLTLGEFTDELNKAGHFPLIRKENKKDLVVWIHRIICKGHVVIEKFYRESEEYETEGEEEDVEKQDI
jgi:hypothetical protein